MSNDVFLSYHHDSASLEKAMAIANSLHAMGLKVWVDHKEIKVGDSIQDLIAKGLDKSDCVVALVSADDTDKGNHWLQNELTLARAKGKPFIPVILDEGNDVDLPESIKDMQAIKISYDRQGVKKLYDAIDRNRSVWSKIKEYLVN